MLQIMVKGIGDGTYHIDTSCAVGKLKNLFPEFYGEVSLKGELKILGNRYTVKATVSCEAKLICDLSLEDYVEEISSDIKVAYLADTDLYYANQDSTEEDDSEKEIVIHEDDKFIDLTEEVAQQLNVSIPMKRVAPKYRDKDLEEIYPEYTESKEEDKQDQSEEIDERWSALKKIKLN